MCDSIANGGPRAVAEKCCPPANVIIASNVLDTTGNVIAGNIISVDGTFTGNLYVAGQIYGNIIYNSLNIGGIINTQTIVADAYFGNGYGLSNINASNITGTISNTNLPPSGVTAGTYGSSTNVSQVTVDQYGLVTAASNVSIYTQWTTVAGNVAYQNGVSIGTLSAPPNGSNLYVLGSANITDVLNVSTLYVNSATVFGSSTLNVFGISNLNSVLASLYIGNASGLSNLNSSNLVGNVAQANVALVVSQPAQPNVTSIGVLTSLNVSGISNLNSITSSLISGNGSGLYNVNASNLVGNVANSNAALVVSQPAQPNITSVGILTGLNVSGISNLNSIVSSFISGNGSGLSNLNSSNLIGNVAVANVASSVTNPSQPNITSVGTLTGLNVQGLLIASNGSAISNLNSSNLVGNVAAANVASSVTNPAQPNITSVGTLTSLAVSGIFNSNLITGNGSGISNINGANVVSTVGSAQSVTGAAQPNITSVGTLSSLSVIGSISGGTISGDGQGLFGIHGNAIVDTVTTANSVVQAAQPNITSVGILTGLNVQGLLIVSNGSAISNINGANVSTVGTAQSVTAASQPNITSVGTLTSLNVSGISNLNSIITSFISGNGSGISNINSSNLTGTISTGNFPTSGVTAGLYGSGANVSSVTVDQYGRVTNATNVAITASQWTSNTGNTIYYANYVGIGATFVPSATLHVIGNAYVSNAVTTTNIFFTNSILDTNLPTTSVTPGGYGSVANIPQIVVDQYGRLTSASNISFTSSTQWTSVDSNVAFGNGVSIGSLTNPPVGSNLYVRGNANIETINTLSANIGTLVVPTQFNVVSANLLTSNIVDLSVKNLANITTANIVTLNVYNSNNWISNIGTLNIAFSATITNLIIRTNANIFSSNTTTANITNLTVRTLANLVSSNITNANISTMNVSTAANITNLTVRTMANLISSNITSANIATLNASSIFAQNSNLVSANVTTENVVTLNASSIFAQNSNLVSANVTTENVVTLNASSIFAQNSNLVVANVTTENVVTLNAFSIFSTNSNNLTLNASSFSSINSNLYTVNVSTENVVTLNASSIFTNSENVTTLNSSAIFTNTLNASSISVTNQANIFSSNLVTANVGTLNVDFLTVTSNILPGTADGNTYLDGNIIVSGNVFSALGNPLGSGGGYYFSLPSDMALQVPYTGALYGTTYPLSIGLSNGFTINGTSTLITVTPNGNFQFGVAGPYLLRAVFNSTDNIKGLAVGSNVADVHGTDQGYMYRYTTFITQNPTELIEIPFNVTDTTKYYYLDLFSVDGGFLRQTANTSGGTYLTVTPLTGGGLATGGPGGTPGTQWISSGSNIYYSNSVGIGAINPQYNLDVVGNVHANSFVSDVVTGRTTAYTATPSDHYIGLTDGRSVTLPLGSSCPVGKMFIIKDEASNASVNSISLSTTGGDLIDGNSNVTLAVNNISVTTLWTGTRWSLI